MLPYDIVQVKPALRPRSGFTLIEMLVVGAVIALLLALILPAVQAARSAARQTQCRNNLRQVGISVQNYVSIFSVMPAAGGWPNFGSGAKPSILLKREYSLFSQLLFCLEQSDLYQSLNFEVGLTDPYNIQVEPSRVESMVANATAISSSLQTLLCPADPGGGTPGWTGGCNYRVNLGSGRSYSYGTRPSEGPICSYHCSSLGETTDGLSATVAFSEKLRGRLDQGQRPDGRTDMIVGGLDYTHGNEQSLERCRDWDGSANSFFSTAGLSWCIGTLPHTCYNHSIGPNSEVSDCVIPVDPFVGHFGARSNHPSGVHVAMADGSVRFVQQSINGSVWKSIATRAGGEVVDLSY